MFPYSGDLIELAIRGTVLLAIGHLLTQLLYRQSASFRGMLMTLCLLSLLALPLAWVSLPKWEALPQEMTVMPYFPVELQPVAQSKLVKAAEIRQANTPTDAPPQWQWPSRQMIICRVWQIGLVLSLCPLMLGWLMLRRVQRQARPVTDESWHELLSDCMNKLKLSRRVWLMQSNQHTMPMTWGWWRCVILIPSEADTWPKNKRQAMLLHELAHIKRRDCLLAGLCQIACAMHWFNPLAWAALLRLRSLREQACDNIVLSGMEQDKASDYAQHLLDIAANLHSPVLANHASIAMARKSSLENRLLAVLDPCRKRGTVTWRLISMMLVFSLVCLVPLAILRSDYSTQPHIKSNTVQRLQKNTTPKPISVPMFSASSQYPKTSPQEHPDYFRLKQRFDEVYCLNRGEFIRYIPEPIIPERNQYLKIIDRNTNDGDAFFFHMVAGEVDWRLSSLKGQMSLSTLIECVTNMDQYRIKGDKKLLQMQIRGDWVMRPDAPINSTDRMIALNKILHQQFGFKIAFDLSMENREVIIVTGRYKFHPLPGFDVNRLRIHPDDMLPDEEGCLIENGFEVLLGRLEWYFKTDFINKAIIPLYANNHIKFRYFSVPLKPEDHQQVLTNLEKQTSLTFTREIQPSFVMRVTEHPDFPIPK